MDYAIILRDGKRIGIAEGDGLAWFNRNCPTHSMAHALACEGYSVDHVDSVDCREVEGLIAGICERLGLVMAAAFAPFSQSRNAKPGSDGKIWRSLNWKIRIGRHHVPEFSFLETSYSQGVAHCPAYKAKLGDVAINEEIETGLIVNKYAQPSRKPIPAPNIGIVMAAIAKDCDVINAGGFEEWACDLGFEPDSRRAECIYRELLEIALKMRAAIGNAALAELQIAASFN